MSRLANAVDRALEASVVGSFTSVGAIIRRRLDHWSPFARLDGVRVVVTGATSGLGSYMAPALAGLGADVVLVGRSASRGAEVLAATVAAGPSGSHSLELADVGDLGQVRELAERVRRGGVDILLHNAGALTHERTLSPQSIETTLATHLVGPHVLTQLLREKNDRTLSRVLVMTSGGMYTQKFDVATLTSLEGVYDGVATYARVKRAQIVWARAAAARWGDETLVAVTHPGWTDTPGLRSSLPTFGRLLRPVLRTLAQGTDTMLWLTGCEQLRHERGALWFDRRTRSAYRLARTRPDDPAADEASLWGHLESWRNA